MTHLKFYLECILLRFIGAFVFYASFLNKKHQSDHSETIHLPAIAQLAHQKSTTYQYTKTSRIISISMNSIYLVYICQLHYNIIIPLEYK